MIHKSIISILLLAALVLSSCQPLPVACTMDAKICPDGSAVGRIGPNCEFAACPEVTACPEDAKLCPDGSAVGRVGPNCEFAACPESPATSTFKEYKSTDPSVCARIRYTCDGDDAFGDETGCGCIRKHNEAAVTLCSTDRDPVCGWSDPEIKCLVYPCASTYSNLCMASIEKQVASTTPGECPKPGSAPVPPTVDTKYAELSAMYGDSLGAQLERCVKDDETIYVVSGSGGFSGIDAYFTDSGKILGTFEWDDMVVVGEEEQKPPRKKSEYTCTTVKETKQSSGKLQAFDCTDPRPTACTKEYMPVCGQAVLNTGDVQTQTYGNKCEACAAMKVISYTEGACAE